MMHASKDTFQHRQVMSCQSTSMGKRKKPADEFSQEGAFKRARKSSAATGKQQNATLKTKQQKSGAQPAGNAAEASESINKRQRIPGKVKKLAVVGHPKTRLSRVHGSNQAGVTLSGAKVNQELGTGGFLAAPKNGTSEEEVWVTRKTAFAYSLKRCMSAFNKRGSVLLCCQ